MKKLMNATCAWLGLTAFGLTAQAIEATQKIDVDATFARRWSEIRTEGIQANEYSASAYTNVKDLPISMGLGLSLVDFNDGDVESLYNLTEAETSWGYNVALEVKLTAPEDLFGTTFIPHAKFSQDLLSDYTIKGKNDNATLKSDMETSGYRVNLGGTYKLDEKLSFLGEYSFGTQRLKQKIYTKVNNRESNSSNKESIESKALVFGVNYKV